MKRIEELIKTISFVLLIAILASCTQGNKVVSTLGKRKYTKGYYSFFHAHNLPHSAVAQVPHKEIEQNNKPQLPAPALGKSNETTAVPIKTIVNNNKVQKTICHKEEHSFKAVHDISGKDNTISSPEKVAANANEDSVGSDLDALYVISRVIIFTSIALALLGVVFILMGIYYGTTTLLYAGIAIIGGIGLFYLILLTI